jgi:hypothetical protein
MLKRKEVYTEPVPRRVKAKPKSHIGDKAASHRQPVYLCTMNEATSETTGAKHYQAYSHTYLRQGRADRGLLPAGQHNLSPSGVSEAGRRLAMGAKSLVKGSQIYMMDSVR